MIPPGWKCGRRIGFLFPHECQRISPAGCPDCENGQIADPYRDRKDRGEYSDYDDYTDAGLLSSDDAGDVGLDDIDFTEADGETLMRPGDVFENDLTDS